MTRHLVLLRHGKAESANGQPDFERPLTDRGCDDSYAAGQWLRSEGYLPDLVICSAARRARQTWKHAAKALDRTPSVKYERALYDAATPDDLLKVIHQVPDDTGVLLLIGHNPTMELLTTQLHPGEGKRDGLRTAGLAVHTVDSSWDEVRPGGAPLAAAVTARG